MAARKTAVFALRMGPRIMAAAKEAARAEHRSLASNGTFDRLVSDIEDDLGGRDQLSAIERTLIEGYAGAAVALQDMNARRTLGQPVDLSQHAQAVSAMVRIASRLGLHRRMKDVTQPSLSEYLATTYGEGEEADNGSEA